MYTDQPFFFGLTSVITTMKPLQLTSLLTLLSLTLTSNATPFSYHGRRSRRGNGTRIFNGSPTHKGELPFVLSILTYQNECSGFLIAPNWVLTAAHCYKSASKYTSKVVVNQPPETGKYEVNIANWFVHPKYFKGDRQVDIALAKTDRPIKNIKPVRIFSLDSDPTEKLKSKPGQLLTLAGFGYINGKTSPTVLYKTTMSLEKKCQAEFKLNDANVICTRGGIRGQSSCNGDSGGPLLLIDSRGEKVALGIHFSGTNRNCTQKPPQGTFAAAVRISRYFNWISGILCAGGFSLPNMKCPKADRNRE